MLRPGHDWRGLYPHIRGEAPARVGGGRRGEELGWAGAGKGELGCGEGGGQLARTTRPLGRDTAPHAEGTGSP